jgi:chromosome partitioning protein
MRSVLVANPKGGSGKTTLATNLAGYLASAREVVCLWDLDRQHSALEWLKLRPGHLPAILRLDERDSAPRKAEWLVLDSPAGLHGKRLTEMVKQSEKVLVPIQPSVFDIAATRAFLNELAEEKAVRKQRTFVGVVGMRVDPRTRAATQLITYLREHGLPLVGWLHDTQLYANAAFIGLSIFDLPPSQSEREAGFWQPIVDWLRED